MSAAGRLGRAEVFLQWKNTDVCYDLYCVCNPEEPQHFDGMFGDTFTCGDNSTTAEWDEGVSGPEPDWCGKKWKLPWSLSAAEIPPDA